METLAGSKLIVCKDSKNHTCLEEKAKSGMSYSWRSILRGIELMKKGVTWRIGDGQNIKIWTDPWLPRDWSRRPFTPRGQNLVTHVSELINPLLGDWDRNLVTDIFWEEDANLILSLPVHENRPNVLTWHFDPKGVFSVRSAYKVSREDFIRSRDRSNVQQSGSGDVDPLWGGICKLDCPNKIKHFLWRFAHNSHPLKMNLMRRRIKLNTICPVCCRVDEDGGHLFFKCKTVKQVWRFLNLEEERVILADKESAMKLCGIFCL